MANFLDVCRFSATSSGTGSFVVSSAVQGYQTPASASAVNGATYRYRAESSDLSQWEVGFGTYTVSSTTLTRVTVFFNSSGGTSPISFTSAPQVAIVALAEDLPNLNTPNAFTDTTAATSTSTGALKTLGGLGVTLAGWFGGLVNAAGGFVFSAAPTTAVALNASGQTPTAVANGASVGILPIGVTGGGLLLLGEGTTGFCAAYLLNDGSLNAILLTGAWVASTTTPASGKMTVAFNISANQYQIYNNVGAPISVKALLLQVN